MPNGWSLGPVGGGGGVGTGWGSYSTAPLGAWSPLAPGSLAFEEAVTTGAGYEPPPETYTGAAHMGWGLPSWPPEYEESVIPTYFAAPPKGQQKLSPLAMAYMARLYPVGQIPKEPVTKEYKPAEGEPALTAVTKPKAASAQLFRRLRAAGAIPLVRQYVEDVLEIPWADYVASELQSLWPTTRKERPVDWRVTRQR